MEEMELDQRWCVFTNIFAKKEEVFLILHSACHSADTLTGERARGMKRRPDSPMCDVSNKEKRGRGGVIHASARLRDRAPPP